MRVHAWVLMGNHYHLFIETPQSLSENCFDHRNGANTFDNALINNVFLLRAALGSGDENCCFRYRSDRGTMEIP